MMQKQWSVVVVKVLSLLAYKWMRRVGGMIFIQCLIAVKHVIETDHSRSDVSLIKFRSKIISLKSQPNSLLFSYVVDDFRSQKYFSGL
jgi:hypothetical protein